MGHVLFRLNKKGDAVLDEDAIKLCPEFSALNSKEILLLILSVDYFSPYAQIPEQDRLRRAKRHVYGKDDVTPESTKKFKEAIECYRGLQYDVRRETLRNYMEKINGINSALLDEQNFRKIPEYKQAITVLQESCKELQAEIDQMNVLEEQKIRGGGTLSMVEIWQENDRQMKLDQRKQKQVRE